MHRNWRDLSSRTGGAVGRLCSATLTGLAGAVLALAGAATGAEPPAPVPQVALVLDTSGSMADFDPRRYGLHLAKVLSATLGEAAAVSALWSAADSCGADAVSHLDLDPARPEAFANALDQVPARGGNRFGAPLAAAAEALASPGAGATLVLFADPGGRSQREQRAEVDAEIARRVLAAGGRHDDVDVRVSLIWNTLDDLDLHVVAPSGELIFFRHARSRCGGELDVDRNASPATRSREPVENVRWVRGEAPPGTYRVLVRNFAFKEAARQPVPFTVEVEVGGKVERYDGIASPNAETGEASEQLVASFAFTPPPPLAPPDAQVVAADLAVVDHALNPDAADCPDPWAALGRLADAGVALRSIALGTGASPFADHPPLGAALRVASQAELVAAVADLAGGLGMTGLSHGSGSGRVEFEVPPHTGETWLLVSADSPLAALQPAADNPSAAAVMLAAGSGQTLAVDGRTLTGYRLVRLTDPAPGTWGFDTGDGAALGWLARMRPALALRVLPPPVLLVGRQATLRIEVVDPATDAPLTDPARLATLRLSADLGGTALALAADGPGRFRTEITPGQTGPVTLTVRLDHDDQQRQATLALNVGEAVWRFAPKLPARQRRDTPLLLSGRLLPADDQIPTGQAPPRAILAQADGVTVRLNDAGQDGDARAGDGTYSATWVPAASGGYAFQFTGDGGAPMLPASAPIEVVDWAELRGSPRLDFGALTSGERPVLPLGLAGSVVHGGVDLLVEISGGDARLPLALVTGPDANPVMLHPGEPLHLHLTAPPADWALAVRVPRCPPRLAEGAGRGELVISTGADGPGQTLSIPLAWQTRPLHWFMCLLPWLLAGLAVLAVLVIAWGIISPARFPRTLGLVLSPEEDLEEGFFQLLRARRGTGSGFYRDARAYIGADFRIGSQRAGAVACLTAGRPRPRLKAMPGQVLERRDADGDWTPLVGSDTLALTGVPYRTESGSLYFELRNA